MVGGVRLEHRNKKSKWPREQNGGAWSSISALWDEGPNQLRIQQRLLEGPVHVEVMNVGGTWVGLGGSTPWAMGNR